jgi:hypothetical protein
VPDRGAGHRPAREGARRLGLRGPRAPEGHRQRGVLLGAVVPEAQDYDTPPRRRARACRRSSPTSSPRRASRTT